MLSVVWSSDTSPEARERLVAWVRARTPEERLDTLDRLIDDGRALALAGIRLRHPEYDDAQARHSLLRLLYGDTLFRRAWPDAPVLAP